MRHRTLTTTAAVVAVVAGLAACADDGTQVSSSPPSAGADVTSDAELPATSDADRAATDAAETGLPDADGLDPDELAGLLWMREEEQLAHDVYLALGDEWGLRVFENISRSEQAHIDQTVALLDRYGLDDPAAGNPTGTFTDPTIQEMYDDLVTSGLGSEIEALTVGATIEELDIADLRARIEATDEAELIDVYTRLEQASEHHLRAFVGQLERLGVEYEPTVLDDVAEILAASTTRGGAGDGSAGGSHDGSHGGSGHVHGNVHRDDT